jgi:DNA polymerase sigma
MVTPKDKKLDEIVRVLKNEFNPSRLFLFGSRATGNARPDSDYDFVLVVPENTKARWENLEKARHLLHEKCNISADVFIYSQKEFDEWKDEFSSIPETAKNTGQEIDLV